MNNNFHLLIILILFIATIAAFFNEKILKLSETTGLTIFSILFSFIITIGLKYSMDHSIFKFLNHLELSIKTIQFQEIVLNYLVGYLLFATTLHVNVVKLKSIAKNIAYLATIGVVISAFITGYLLYFLLHFLNIDIPLSSCLIFGALISPTDPIAVMGVLKNNKNIPIHTQRKILGESLFNDATGILLLTILITIFTSNGIIGVNVQHLDYNEILKLFFNEVILTLALALFVGWFIGKKIISRTNSSSTALLLTLFSSGFVYNLCNIYHLSSPLAMVVLGLTLGHYLRATKLDNTKIDDFWNIVDDLLNTCLFVLIGLKVLTIDLDLYWFLIGGIVIFVIMFARYISIIIPSLFIKSRYENFYNVNKKSLLMTLGGVRGGISLALALSIIGLPNILIYITYSVVVLSIVCQSYLFEIYCKKTTIKWD